MSIIDGNPDDIFGLEEVTDLDSQTTSWYIRLLNPDSVTENMPYELLVRELVHCFSYEALKEIKN